MDEYLVWSNEHRAWWGPNNCGYYTAMDSAGRYTREQAIAICRNARGGRQFNENPSEVPIPLADAVEFWPDESEEWRRAKHLQRMRETDDRFDAA